MEYDRKMDHPSNGVSIVGYLRPAFADEETYVRRQFHLEDSDGDNLGWKGILCLCFSYQTWMNFAALDKVTRCEEHYCFRWIQYEDIEWMILLLSLNAYLYIFFQKKEEFLNELFLFILN